MRYNILILHDIDDFHRCRKAILDHIMCFERYSERNHNYYYHYIREPVTDTLRKIPFHVIIVSTKALSYCRYCHPRDLFYRIKDAWSFMRDLGAVKLAFPQDDYHRTNDINELLQAWSIDIVYTVLPKYARILYPSSLRTAEIKEALTGYVDDFSIESGRRFNRSFDDRSHDIVQRVTMHPPWGGAFSQIKGKMALRFAESSRSDGRYSVDISTRAEDVLTGDQWLQFLGDGRYVLGNESGVSLWDPEGTYLDQTRKYLDKYPSASFEEVEASCFPGKDGQYTFRAISPRLFESAVMGCSPILTEGEYLGLLRPWEHYIPVRLDLNDVEDALEAMVDSEAAKRRVEACYETLVHNPMLRYSSFVRNVTRDVDRLAAGRGFRETDPSSFLEAIEKHRAQQRRLPPLVPIPFQPSGSFFSACVHGVWQNIPPAARAIIPTSIKSVARQALLRNSRRYREGGKR